MRSLLQGVGIILLAVALAAAGVVAWLFLTSPGPREPTAGWSLAHPLPSARGELATAVGHARPCPDPPCPEAERLYVIGGLAGLARPQARVAAYDAAEGLWREAPSLPAPRHHLAAVGWEGAVYAGGGTSDVTRPWTPRPELWRLPAGADHWEPLPPMPEPRWGHRMVVHEGRLYVIGGEGPTSRVLIYTPQVGWRPGAEMPVPRDHLSVVVANGRIWAIGGRAPGSLARVDLYDPASDRWEPGPDLPAPTSGAAEGVLEDVIYVLGGEEPALRGQVYDRHWMLDARAASPRWERAPPPPLPVHGADGVVFRGSMVIAGGASRHGLLSVTAWTDLVQRLTPP